LSRIAWRFFSKRVRAAAMSAALEAPAGFCASAEAPRIRKILANSTSLRVELHCATSRDRVMGPPGKENGSFYGT